MATKGEGMDDLTLRFYLRNDVKFRAPGIDPDEIGENRNEHRTENIRTGRPSGLDSARYFL